MDAPGKLSENSENSSIYQIILSCRAEMKYNGFENVSAVLEQGLERVKGKGGKLMFVVKTIFDKVKTVLAASLISAMTVLLCPSVGVLKAEAIVDYNKYGQRENIRLGIGNISGPEDGGAWQYLYFGQYTKNGSATPTRYRVLSKEQGENSYSTGKTALLLDSDVIFERKPFDSSAPYTNEYSKSTIRRDINDIRVAPYTEIELKAVCDTSATYRQDGNNVDSGFSGDKFFLLRIGDLYNDKWGYKSDADRKKKMIGTDDFGSYWTRSAIGSEFKESNDGTSPTNIIKADGDDWHNWAHSSYSDGVSPAFYLDVNKVLFVENNPSNSREFTATIIDDDINLETDVSDLSFVSDKKADISFKITGSDAGVPGSLSVMAISGNNVLYYNPLAIKSGSVSSGSGVATLDLSKIDGTLNKDYTLLVFAEKINGRYKTDYASAPVRISHIHSDQYAAQGNSIVKKCSDCGKIFSDITINAPGDLSYDGSVKEASYNTDYNREVFPYDVKVRYYKDSKANEISAPINPGKYYVELTYAENTLQQLSCNVEFTLQKVIPVVTAPKENTLRENGSSQALVSAGLAVNGIMKYALGTGSVTAPSPGSFSTSIPEGTKAGNYYVWYMAAGNANYSDTDPKCLTVTIAAKEQEAHKHSLVKTDAVAATANGAGNSAYWTCSGCGRFFADEAGTKEIVRGAWGVPATGAGSQNNNGTTDSGSTTSAPAKKGKTIANSSASFVVTSGNSKNPTVKYSKNKKVKASKVTIPGTVKIAGVTYKITEISPKAFKNNKKLKKVTIDKNITKIGSEAFSGCKALTEAAGAQGVVTIGANAFNGCVKLKKAPVGAKVTSIGARAFYNCSSITSFTIPAKVTKLGNQFAGKTPKLKTVTVKSRKLAAKNIAKGAFKGTGSSKTVVKVPKGKKAAYKKYFQNKGLDKKIKLQEAK